MLLVKLKTRIKCGEQKCKEAPVKIYEHLVGERFSHTHKIACGVCTMVVGVFTADLAHYFGELHFVSFILDGVGYMVHGAGCLPIFDLLAAKLKK